MCLLAQVATLGRGWLRHCTDQECCSGDLLTSHGQRQGDSFAAFRQDPLPSDTSHLPSSRTMAGTSLLEHEAQLLHLPVLIVELGFELSELRQLWLLFHHVCQGGWRRSRSRSCRGRHGASRVYRDVIVIVGLSYHSDEAFLSRIIIPLAGVVGTGEAIVCRSLK